MSKWAIRAENKARQAELEAYLYACHKKTFGYNERKPWQAGFGNFLKHKAEQEITGQDDVFSNWFPDQVILAARELVNLYNDEVA